MSDKSTADLPAGTLRKTKRRTERDIRTSKVFNRIIQMTLGSWLEINFKSKPENREVFKTVKPPYFIMSTHNSVFDPFLIADFVPEPISYIVTDAAFRKPFMGWALGLVGSIPKTKGISDLATIKNIMKIKSKGGVIGIFPEGQNPWDGHALPVIYSTAKLVKMMKIPVIAVIKQGAYFSMPRWAKSRRKGKVTMRYDLGLSAEEIKKISVDEIYQRLSEIFEHDEYELQRRDMVRFTGKDRAEYLEIVLFICPECRSIASLRSQGDKLICDSCGYTVIFNEYNFFETPDGKLHFDSIRDWNVWQEEYLTGYLNGRDTGTDAGPIFEDAEIDLKTGYKAEPLKPAGLGVLSLYADVIRFELQESAHGADTHRADEDNAALNKDAGPTTLEFPIDRIEGLSVQEDEIMEFYLGDTLYSFKSENKRRSMYKWYMCLSILRTPEKIT